jgi:hypothetical protein
VGTGDELSRYHISVRHIRGTTMTTGKPVAVARWAKARAVFPAEATMRPSTPFSRAFWSTTAASNSLKVQVSSSAPFSGQ